MSEEKRKLAWYEIGKGNFAAEVQQKFEEAQRTSKKMGGAPVTISIKLKVSSDPKEDFGEVTPSVKVSTPEHKSRSYATECLDGVAIGSAETLDDLLQTNLDLEIPKPLHLAPAQQA